MEMCREIAVAKRSGASPLGKTSIRKPFRFSVYVSGLTNAYRWGDAAGEYKPSDPILTGRTLYRKTLKLNFWRPADEYFEHEEEIRYGCPEGLTTSGFIGRKKDSRPVAGG